MIKDLIVEKINHFGLITLNRPAALNSLNLDMVRCMHKTLELWEHDDTIFAVVIKGAGEKAFCAGGDILCLHESISNGFNQHMKFFKEEFLLDEYIYQFPKPYIAIMDGYVIGGGMGIVQGADFRIVTERSNLAMPETSIGYFPDVGASYFLSRCPGFIGSYLGVTGITIKAEDALYAKLADWYLPSNQLNIFLQGLGLLTSDTFDEKTISQLLTQLGGRKKAISPSLSKQRYLIDSIFSLPTVQDIAHSLKMTKNADRKKWAEDTLNIMSKRSPLSLVGALRTIHLGRGLSLQECFAMEIALVERWIDVGDLLEGIRALIIHKDNSPQWKYRIDELTSTRLQALLPSIF